MPLIPLLAGVVLFWIGSMLVREFLTAAPAVVARRMKQGGGTVLIVFALLLLAKGQVGTALGFGALGFWLFTGRRASLFGAARQKDAAPCEHRDAVGEAVHDVRQHGIGRSLDRPLLQAVEILGIAVEVVRVDRALGGLAKQLDIEQSEAAETNP